MSEMTFLPAFINNAQEAPKACDCDDAPLRLPTVNWSADIDQPPASCYPGDAIEQAFATNARAVDDDTLALPPTLAQVLAGENREAEAENKPAAQFVLNTPDDDDAPLPLPYCVW